MLLTGLRPTLNPHPLWAPSTAFHLDWDLNFNWTIAAPWILLFSHSAVDFLVCLRSLSWCMTQFQPSFVAEQMAPHLTLGIEKSPRAGKKPLVPRCCGCQTSLNQPPCSPQCVNTHLNAPDQQTGKPSIFIEVLTLTDDQLIKCIWLTAATYPLNSYGRIKGNDPFFSVFDK